MKAGFLSRVCMLFPCVGVATLLFLHSQGQLQVGYATITAGSGGRLPVGTALFSFTNSAGVLLWQAGVGAAEPIGAGRIFVDQQGTRTAIALVNPAEQSASATFTLRDSLGREMDRKTRAFNPRQHLALFIDELFTSAPGNFSGSLTFESDQNLAAITLRENRNAQGEPIYATLPVLDLSLRSAAQPIVFPHIGAGPGLSTQIVLLNGTNQRSSGIIQLIASDGTPLPLEIQGSASSEFPYQIEANGTFRTELSSSSRTAVGYALVIPDPASSAPSGSAIFQFKAGGKVISEAGVSGVMLTTAARMFVDNAGTRTGVAVAGAGQPAAKVTFNLLDRSGGFLQTTSRDLPPKGHLAIFADELFPDLPQPFTGLLEITSTVPIAPISLKLTINARNDPILTTLPVADLTRPFTGASLVFPQIGFGTAGAAGNFSTQLIMINTDKTKPAAGTVNFYRSDGSNLEVSLGGQTSSRFDYRIDPGGTQSLSAGNVSAVAQILIDASNPEVKEVVVNEGNAIQLNPAAIDSNGNLRTDLVFTYNSVSPEIATVDASGRIQGKSAGFSTLTIAAGGVVAAGTITVVKITSGVSGFEVTGVAQDLGRRLYLANTRDHTVLLAPDLFKLPEIYAGTTKTAGLRNDERLKSLFRNPAFLAINEADGSLYVSDSGNNAIRRVRPGPGGQVETLALSGPLNNPQGVALDNRGSLWVADSGSHTIKRINLTTGVLSTIAGQPGSSGRADGTGDQARFNSPVGIAIEMETLAQQLERERTGAPLPPVSVIVADTGNGIIRRVIETGKVETIGAGAAGPAGKGHPSMRYAASFSIPTGVAVDPLGNIYVTERGRNQVRAILQNGTVVAAAQANTFVEPRGIAISSSGRVVVADMSRSAQQISYGDPRITAVTPLQVSIRGGTKVTIKGQNFSTDSSIIIGGVVVADVQVVDTQTITFTTSKTPALPSGRTTLTVQNRGGLAQALLIVTPVPLNELPAGYITTVAGGSTFSGDGGSALLANLNNPQVIAFDSLGNFYIADWFNHRIRKVDSRTGVITTVAGTGQLPATGLFSGDNGPATAAALSFPSGTVVDSAGNIYIAAQGGIYKVDAQTGIITTIKGLPGGALAIDSAQNLYVFGLNLVKKVNLASGIVTVVAGNGQSGFSGDGGLATAASLNSPRGSGLAIDLIGNLYIADESNNRIRKVDVKTGIINTAAGTGQQAYAGDNGPATAAAFNRPGGVTLDLAGNLYIADSANDRIRKVDAQTGIITTVVGSGRAGFSGDNGLAIGASLSYPEGLAFDSSGNLYLVDYLNHRVRKVDAQTGIITTIAGTSRAGSGGDGGPAIAADLQFPRGLAVFAGNLYVADSNNNRIRKVDSQTGIITAVAGTGQGGLGGDGDLATRAGLSYPTEIVFDSLGNLYIAEYGDIRKVDAQTGIISTLAGNGSSFEDNIPATLARLSDVRGLAFDASGNLYFAEAFRPRIRKIDAQTALITTIAGTGEAGFSGDNGPATAATLNTPSDLAFDSTGNLYIADTSNNRIRRIDARTGIITTIDTKIGISAFSLSYPNALAFDSSGNLFVADSFHVFKVDTRSGMIKLVAGSYDSSLGDGGAATAAALNIIQQGLAIDSFGNLFIADTYNHRIRAVRGPTTALKRD